MCVGKSESGRNRKQQPPVACCTRPGGGKECVSIKRRGRGGVRVGIIATAAVFTPPVILLPVYFVLLCYTIIIVYNNFLSAVESGKSGNRRKGFRKRSGSGTESRKPRGIPTGMSEPFFFSISSLLLHHGWVWEMLKH